MVNKIHFRRVPIALFALTAALFSSTAPAQDSYREARLRMVETELVREGISNKAVLDAMRQVPRHAFVAQEYRSAAYFDQALAIGHGQTISPPFIVAYMTESLDPKPEDRVLEIGTGSGYQAAVLSGIVKEVYTIEIVPDLGEHAAEVLKEQGYTNVTVMVGDGYRGWPKHAPFDKIIVTCSPEKVPDPLVEQLKEGGRMIVPLGERYEQVFHLFEKKDGKLVQTKLLPTMFVPMTGVAEENRKIKPDPTNPELRNGGFEDVESNGILEAWYYQRQARLDTEKAPEGKVCLTFENTTAGRGAQVLQAMGVDGSQVSTLEVSLQAKAAGLKNGPKPYEKPGLIVHYFDSDRRPVGQEILGPWRGSFNWKPIRGILHVPPKAREAIIRVGLNGATGTLSVDDIRLKAAK